MSDILDKYIACMVLHAVGDAIGFKNSEWEFKKGKIEKALEKMYEFIDLGGINHLSLKNWIVSDDTIMHMKTAKGLLSEYNSVNTLCVTLSKYYIEALEQFEREKFTKRYPGHTTITSIKKIRDGANWNDIQYDTYSGGSGASMRCLCIGLAYYGKKSRQNLLQVSIESSRITHNSAVGYLGGFTSALFSAFAIEKVDIKKWPFKLIKYLTDGTITDYIKKVGRDFDNYSQDYHVFVDKWKKYVADKFDKDGNIIKTKSTTNLYMRSKYYIDNFAFSKQVSEGENVEHVNSFFPGSGGDDSVIIAYDCLIDSGNSWEKLVIYSMLHAGDTDTTGCIAAGWYGCMRGFEDVPNITIENLEYLDKLKDLGTRLYNKFYKS